MNQYIDLSIKKIEIKNPKRDLKPIVNLQNKVILTLSHEEYYYPTDEKTIEESLKGDYILLGVYNRDKLIAASFACEDGLFFSRPITDWMEIPENKIMCQEFVVVDMEYRGNGIQKRFMDATVREANRMGYDNSNFKNSTSGTFHAFFRDDLQKIQLYQCRLRGWDKKIVVNIKLSIAVFHGLATSVLGKETIFNIGMMFVILCVTFILGFVLKHFIRKPYDKYLPFIACGYEGGMIGYSLYTGLVGVENLSVIAVIDIAALLFTFSIMSNVLVLIEDGKKVSVIEIVQNAFKTPAFLAVILGILASVSGLMNGFMLSPAGVIWTTMKDMITAAMSPMILLVVGYEVQLNRELLGTCLKTVIIRAVMQLIFAIAAISLIHILGRSDRLLEIAIIVYMSIPGSMGIRGIY